MVEKHPVYIGAGSNHNPRENLSRGVAALNQIGRLLAASPVYESAAADDADAPPYWNAVVKIETTLALDDLKQRLSEIEDERGRVRKIAEGEKSPVVALDFDILLYGSYANVTYAGDRRIPHQDIWKRAFVAVPLADIAGNHIIGDQTVAQIARRFEDHNLRRLPHFSLYDGLD